MTASSVCMHRTFLISVLLLSALHSFAQTQKEHSPNPNFKELVSHADLTYDKPVNRSEEGMPLGNGRMGSLVWTTPSAIRFQLNRVDVFANNSASNNFYERHTDYCSGLGFVDVDFLSEEIFTDKKFQQHLSCYDGLMNVQGNGISARVLAWNEQDVMAMQIEDNRALSSQIHINLRTLRSPVTKRGNHEAISTVIVIDNKIVLTQVFKEDQYYCASAVVIEVVGGDAKASLANETMARLSIAAGKTNFAIMMSSAASFNPEEDIVAVAMKKLEFANRLGFEGMYQSNKVWWKGFWEKAFVQLHSDDGKADLIEKHYTYYLYIMASSSRGAYPPKFNGMIWTTGGDDRKWGNLYWGANQSCLYNALFPANRDELMDPMFNMYSSMRQVCETAALQQWGSKGIFIPETVAFDGMVPLPEAIAKEMRYLYLLKKPWHEKSQSFIDYASTKMPFLSRWNWKKDEGWKEGRWHSSDKGGGPFGHVTHIFSRGAKIAYQYWLKYEYTQDKTWLSNQAYPMLKGVAEFYRNFPNLKKDNDGKYHIYDVNDNESVWGGHNTVEEIASMRGIFPVAIKAADLLNVDEDLRRLWKEVLNNLSPLPSSENYLESPSTQPITWARALPPIIQGNGNRLPDPNTLPVWFFDLCTLESDTVMKKIANATFDAYFTQGINAKTDIHVLSKLPVAGSLLGNTASTKYLISNQIETSEIAVMPNRMDLREGSQATSIQRLGRAAEALHYALCQAVPPQPGLNLVIHIFPAWPREWDAHFKLLCRGGFLVSSSLQKGKIEFVEIMSQAGAVCRIRNPWPGQEIVLYRNHKRWKKLKDDLLVFTTKKDDHFKLELGR
jgi:hypothetical protein